MKKDNLVYIQDIIDAIEKINDYALGMNFETFQSDTLKQDAILRNFTIIGEGSSKLSEEFTKQYPKFPIREAISMRNKVVHDYGNINLDVVWKTVKKDIPELYLACKEIISSQ